MRLLRHAAAVAALATACSSRQLSIILLAPVSVPPDAGTLAALTFSLSASWDGGQVSEALPGLGQGFSLGLPSDVPLDVEIDGLAPDLPSWRGEWHGMVASQGSAQSLSVLMLPVGFISSFPNLSGLPMLSGSSATPLDSGRVLILGGIVGGGIQQSAWIYDQNLVAFSPAAPPARPRAHHLALSLGGDEVLLAGGDTQETSLELYSPTDGGTPAGTLSEPQLLPSGVAIGDGAILGCGRAPDGGSLAGISAEAWPAGGSLSFACGGGKIVAGSDGALVISAAGTVEAVGLDGSPATFGESATPRSGFGAASDGEGGAVVVGGFDDAGASRLVEDVGRASLSTGQLDTPRVDAVVLPFDGGYLVVGGIDASGEALASAQIIRRSSLLSGGELPLAQPRHFPAAAQIPGYRLILIVSGQGTNGEPSGGLDLFAAP